MLPSRQTCKQVAGSPVPRSTQARPLTQSRVRVQAPFDPVAPNGQSQNVRVGLVDESQQAIVVLGPQPVFCAPSKGTQLSTNGTSQTFCPPACPATTSRVQVEFVQSPSLLQNRKQRARHDCSRMQTSPGPQLSV